MDSEKSQILPAIGFAAELSSEVRAGLSRMGCFSERPQGAFLAKQGPARLWIIEREAFDRFVADDPIAGVVLFKALGKVLCKRVRSDSELMLRKAEEMRSHLLDMDY